MNDYHLMTANEAGEKTPFQKVVDDLTDGCGCACHTGTGYRTLCEHCRPDTEITSYEPEHPDPGIAQHGNLPPPSKPCTEGDLPPGEHCFCVHVYARRDGKSYYSCCECDELKLGQGERVPGHGPHRTELVRE